MFHGPEEGFGELSGLFGGETSGLVFRTTAKPMFNRSNDENDRILAGFGRNLDSIKLNRNTKFG